MPCTGAAGQLGCSCLPLSCSAAAKVSAGTQLMNRGSPPLPQTEKSHIISEWYFQCKSAITEGGNGTGETQRDFPLQGNRNYKQRGLALSSSQSEVSAHRRAEPARVLQRTARPARQFPMLLSPITQASLSSHVLCQRPLVLGTEGPHPLLQTPPTLLVPRAEASQPQEPPPWTMLPAPRCPFYPVASS